MTTRDAPTLDRLVTRRTFGPQPPKPTGVDGHPLPVTPTKPFDRKIFECVVWAKRRDLRARDYIADGLAPTGRVTVIYIVTVDAETPWTVEDQVIDRGRHYSVAEIAELEGGVFIELTVSAIGI